MKNANLKILFVKSYHTTWEFAATLLYNLKSFIFVVHPYKHVIRKVRNSSTLNKNYHQNKQQSKNYAIFIRTENMFIISYYVV